MNSLGVAVRNARHAKKLTQDELARLVSVSRSRIAALEIRGSATTALLDAVANVLDLDVLPMGHRTLRWTKVDVAELRRGIEIAVALLQGVLAVTPEETSRDDLSETALVDRILSAVLPPGTGVVGVRPPLSAEPRTPHVRRQSQPSREDRERKRKV